MCKVNWRSLTGVLIMLALAGVFLLGACAAPAPAPAAPSPAAPAPAPPAKTYEIKFSTGLPAKHAIVTKLIEPWMDIVQKESKGRIKVTLYPGGVLAPHPAAYEAVAKGTVEAVQAMATYNPEVFTLTDVMHTPFAAPNSLIAASLLSGPLFDKYFAKEFANVKIISLSQTSPDQIFTTKKPVRKAEDLKGMRIRVSGGVKVDMFKRFGAIPVGTPTPEMYEGLQKGVLDGTLFLIGSAEAYKLWEVTKYVTLTNLSGSVGMLLLNKAFYEGLPRDLQLVVDYASKDVTKWSAQMYVDEDIRVTQRLKQEGVEVISLAPDAQKAFRELGQGAVDAWIDAVEKKGLPARQLYSDLAAEVELYGHKIR